jgi:hypothetical protein
MPIISHVKLAQKTVLPLAVRNARKLVETNPRRINNGYFKD